MTELPDSYLYYEDVLHLHAKSYFQRMKYSDSIRIYEQLLSEGDGFFNDKYEMELLICQVSLLPKSNKQTSVLLNKIVGSERHTYQASAKKLKTELMNQGHQF